MSPLTSSIPSGAADRIIRNPHSLPRVPAQLAGVIANNRHRERNRLFAEQSYWNRRLKIDSDRNKRIRESLDEPDGMLNGSAIATTPSPPQSPLLEISHFAGGRSRSLGSEGISTVYRRHRRSPSSSYQPPSLQRRRSLFDIADPAHLSSIKNTYYTPTRDDKSSASLMPPPWSRTAAMSYTPRRSGVSQQPTPETPPRRHSIDVHTSPVSKNVKSPEERCKLRYKYSKRPAPSSRSVSFGSSTSSNVGLQRRFSAGTSHPGWHRILRDEYKYNGLEDIWKNERNQFMQNYRRDRQFMKQSVRRLSDASL